MKQNNKLIIIFIIFLQGLSILHANEIKDRYTDVSLRIISKALSDSTAYKRLAYLCDSFGPRLSGSKNLENSINWILKEMKKDGYDNVSSERVKVPYWKRGKESVEILKPYKRDLKMLGLGSSVSTPKSGIISELIVVNNFDELEKYSDKIKGNIILYNVPFTTYGETVKYRYNGANMASKHGASGALIRSVGTWSMDTPHTGNMAYDEKYKKIPAAALTMEDAMMLGRMYDRGQKITIKMKMEARTVGDKWSRNILSEIKGSEFPNEIVVVGGHIDSWDVGQGAHDDGGGCIAAWETLRIIKELGLKPKRTIRCVLWTNEENGLKGSKAYRDMHLDELDDHILAIESDAGVFAPTGFGFTGSDDARVLVDEIHELLKPIRANLQTNWGRAPDVAILNDEGIPVMSLNVDNSRYFWYHHSSADTFDKVNYYDFNHCVAAMTIMAYVVADMDTRLPRN
ncbi:MAG: carboxypeptidase [Candidatus Marinimicrobia bacterium]|nr:carboxypeptidase [Candidatus Neomarinimicrobiota bacterium]